jgi:hypothetical protein
VAPAKTELIQGRALAAPAALAAFTVAVVVLVERLNATHYRTIVW